MSEQESTAPQQELDDEHLYKWYVLQVLSSHEKKVKRQIEELREQAGMTKRIVEVLLPTERVSEVKAGKTKISEKRLWPGYLLIKMNMDDDSWHFVNRTNGVIHILPSPLSDREVDAILADLRDKKETVTQKHKFKVGDHIKIVDGVFVNSMGTVQEVFHEKGQLSAMVSIFGRDTRVDDLKFEQVEEVADSSGIE